MISKRMLKVVIFSLILIALFGATVTPAQAQTIPPWPGQQPKPILNHTMLAKAKADECFHGIGEPYDPDPTCSSSPGIPKVNQAYVWGLTEAYSATANANLLWFGTAPNVLCGVLGGFLGLDNPIQTPSWVCEFSSNQSPFHSDFRPPHIYTYNVSTKTQTDVTPVTDPLILRTSGLRSAGNLNGVVLLAGPAAVGGGVNMFAYDANTGAYLGSANFQEYSNIRRWITVNGALYAGVAKKAGGGAVLRWTGDATSPFQVEEVGLVDSDAAEVAYHDSHLFVNTWPTLSLTSAKPATLWMSPAVPAAGLTAADAATPWTKIFSMDMYDPDPLTATMTGGGAMASFGGYLYWGTMHVPLMSGIYHLRLYYPNPTTQEVLQNLLGEHRAISIFRGKNLGTPRQKIELVYGEIAMPAYVNGKWSILPNKLKANGINPFPLYGLSGFGNYFNNYTWSMTVYKNQLYVGTMDWSYLFNEDFVPGLEQALGLPVVNLPKTVGKPGADLWRFPSIYARAVPESLDGIGNVSSYGVRNLLVGDNALYAGMANPMNLLTDPAKPLGGWELIRMVKP